MSNWSDVIKRANADPAFRTQLKADPMAACKEAGCAVPSGTQVEVVDCQRGDLNLLLGSKTNVPELDTLLTRAENDPAFKKELLNDPRAIVEKACGEKLPATCQVRIHEPASDRVRLLLKPAASGDEELSEHELQSVAGGGLLKRIYDRLCGDFKGTVYKYNTDGSVGVGTFTDLSSGEGTYTWA